MRIAFIWDWEIVPEVTVTWRDGICAALKLLSERHDVKIFSVGEVDIDHPYFRIHAHRDERLVQEVVKFSPDVILTWADCTRPHADALSSLGIPMALCFAGGATKGEHWYKYGHIFVENEEYREKFEAQGASVSFAFGANTAFYRPLGMTKTLDVFFPATFADWKRHDLFAKATKGMKAMAVGYMNHPREEYAWRVPNESGVIVAGHQHPYSVRALMDQSKCVLVTSKNVGGSQRTVLEALSMNVPVIVTSDNIKCCEYLRQLGLDDWIAEPDPESIREVIASVRPQETRSGLVNTLDEHAYANAIEKGLEAII